MMDPGRIVLTEGIDRLIYRYDNCLNKLYDYVEERS
jgi:hypothetical protein